MYQTYIAPSETSPSSLEIKRALLTYDKVLVADPEDRDLFPPQMIMQVIIGLPIVGMNMGPIRPLGKAPGYDEDFDRLMDELNYARRDGIIDVVSVFEREPENMLSIGGVPSGGYPLNSTFMLQAYRSLARDNEALVEAISKDPLISTCTPEILADIAGDRAIADGGFNQDPKLPDIDGDMVRPELRAQISSVARSRLAAVLRSVGYCATKELVPTFHNSNYIGALNHITSRAVHAIDTIAEDDPYLTRRNKVLDIAHSEYINDAVLDKLSLDDVLALRTRAWGEQAEARDTLLQSAAELAKNCSSEDEFDRAVRDEIANYKKTWDELANERRQLGFSITCDVLEGGAKTLSAGLVGGVGGAYAQLQTGVGAAALLLAGCIFAAQKTKEYKPMRDALLKAEAEFNDHACFGLHDFYRRLE